MVPECNPAISARVNHHTLYMIDWAGKSLTVKDGSRVKNVNPPFAFVPFAFVLAPEMGTFANKSLMSLRAKHYNDVIITRLISPIRGFIKIA